MFAWSVTTFLYRLLRPLSTIYYFYNLLFKEMEGLAVKFWLLGVSILQYLYIPSLSNVMWLSHNSLQSITLYPISDLHIHTLNPQFSQILTTELLTALSLPPTSIPPLFPSLFDSPPKFLLNCLKGHYWNQQFNTRASYFSSSCSSSSDCPIN